MAVRVLTEAELKAAVTLAPESIACIERAIAALSLHPVVMPPVLSMEIPEHNGEVDVKTAYVPGLDSFAIKISPGFFDNPSLGLPSLNGLMVVFSAKTGLVEALLMDNGYLTDIRTACAGAVAARFLARPDAHNALIVGTGVQARLQLQALCQVLPIKSAEIWGRSTDKAARVARDLGEKLSITIQAVDDLSLAVPRADVVVTTTPSRSPLLQAEWLRPGQHITAMGSDADYKNEIDPACFNHLSRYVADRRTQTMTRGELRTALAYGNAPATEDIPELSEIITGHRDGRVSAADITLCDLTGMGVQDTAIAAFARERAEKEGAGILI